MNVRNVAAQIIHSVLIVKLVGTKVYLLSLNYCFANIPNIIIPKLFTLLPKNIGDEEHICGLHFSASIFCDDDTEGLNKTHYHPIYCHKYIICASTNNTVEGKCIDNKVYDLIINQCVGIADLPCAQENTITTSSMETNVTSNILTLTTYSTLESSRFHSISSSMDSNLYMNSERIPSSQESIFSTSIEETKQFLSAALDTGIQNMETPTETERTQSPENTSITSNVTISETSYPQPSVLIPIDRTGLHSRDIESTPFLESTKVFAQVTEAMMVSPTSFNYQTASSMSYNDSQATNEPVYFYTLPIASDSQWTSYMQSSSSIDTGKNSSTDDFFSQPSLLHF